MKKAGSFILSIAVSFLFLSCEAIIMQNENALQISDSFIKAVNLQAEGLQESYDIVSRYVAIPSEESNYENLGEYLPEDLSSLTRVDSNNNTITLEQELDSVVRKFDSKFKQVLPDTTSALSLSYVSSDVDGIKIDEDSVIPLNSMEGILAVGVLNQVAEGSSYKDAVNSVSAALNSSFNTIDNDEMRSLWKSNTVTWSNGIVYYNWGRISEEHKIAVKKAMQIWTEKTHGQIRFEPFVNTGWNSFLTGLFLRGYVTIQDSELGYDNIRGGTTGKAIIGYHGGSTCYVKIDNDLYADMALKTAVHELGHVLGLYHEHRRCDRDDYIEITESGEDYEKLPLEISGFRWGVKGLNVGLCTINIYYPIWWETQNSVISGSFDFDSCMLYSGFKVKSDKISLNNGKAYTIQKTMPSENDVNMILRQY